MLLDLRWEVTREGQLPWSKRMLMKLTSFTFRHTWLYATLGRMARWMVPKLPRAMVYNRWNGWGRQRDLPDMPQKSFRQAYRERHEQ